nr:retrovirus-related Pol polyprotein from transposon TNT 1-94 [Tanacetum cinerariifolium]
MVTDLRYFSSLKLEVDSLRSQLETQKTQFLNEIDRLYREYYYADHMNAILGVYTELDEVTNLQCDYLELLENHDMCVLNSVAKPLKKTVASESNQKPRNITRKLYERVSKTCSWWYPKFTPLGYKWKPKSAKENVNPNTSMPLGSVPRTANILEHMTSRRSTVSNTPLSSNSFAARRDCPIHRDSGCSKRMTRNLKLLINFVAKFLRTVKFGNDQITPMLGYGDLIQRAVTIKQVYYVEGLNHNLFSIGQFCDADLEVAFWKSTCYIRDLKGNDLLTGSRGMDLYSITLQDTNCPNPISLMAKASSSQAWLWHRLLSHLNFDSINFLPKNDIVVGLPKFKFVKDHLCSSCELRKAKRKSFHTKLTPSSKRRLQLIHMDLCGPMRVASINGKRYVLVIVDDYSRFTWTHFLRDGENLDKMKKKGDACIFMGYSTQSRAYRVFNKRTRVIIESIHVNFNELPHMASDNISSDPAPE